MNDKKEEPVRSVYFDQSEILRGIMKLHCPDGFDCDITYGNGGFWRDLPQPFLKFDIDPQLEGVMRACSSDLPIPDKHLDSVVFDPPFLTYIRAGREHSSIMAKRFSGYWRYDELEDHYKKTLMEAARVLRTGGIMVFKCQDIIHNHKLYCTHANVIAWGGTSRVATRRPIHPSCKTQNANAKQISKAEARSRFPQLLFGFRA